MQEGLFHWSTKAHGRSKGRSATGCAAYRAGVRIVDERTGLVFDYRPRGGVSHREILLPDGAPAEYHDRATLWNAVERSETRTNSTVCRELEVALPNDLPPEVQKRIITQLVRELVDDTGFAADVCLHDPHTRRMAAGEDTTDATGTDDSKNPHAHVLLSCRVLTQDGFTDKRRDWDSAKTGGAIITQWRARYAELVNDAYREHGIDKFIDHRSFEERGIDRLPTVHVGTGPHSAARRKHNDEVRAANARLAALEEERAQVLAELAVLAEAPAPAPVVHAPAPVAPVELVLPAEPAPVLVAHAEQADTVAPVEPEPDDALGLDALVRDYEQSVALRKGARTYGEAQRHKADQASTARSLQRELDELEPPRFATMHRWFGTDTWGRFIDRRAALVQAQATAQARADALGAVMRKHRQMQRDWDSKGYKQHKELVAQLQRVAPDLLEDEDRPLAPVQPTSSRPMAPTIELVYPSLSPPGS